MNNRVILWISQLFRRAKNASVLKISSFPHCVILLGAITFLPILNAKEKSPLDITLKAQAVVVQADGREEFKDKTPAAPGSVVVYTATYRNIGPRTLNNLKPALPIPASMTYLENSAQPAPTEASLDGITFEAVPIRRNRTLPSGAVVTYEVPASHYRALRWDAGNLAPASTLVVTARARISGTTP